MNFDGILLILLFYSKVGRDGKGKLGCALLFFKFSQKYVKIFKLFLKTP